MGEMSVIDEFPVEFETAGVTWNSTCVDAQKVKIARRTSIPMARVMMFL